MKIKKAVFVKGVVDWAGLPTDGRAEVAFVGRSNVGKSSLINQLLRQKGLARTSGTPGKTREFNFYRVNDRFYVVDLPGYGYAKTSKAEREAWAERIDRYIMEREPLRAVFHLIDSRHPPTDLDRDVLAAMRGQRVPYVAVLTKADKLSGNERGKHTQRAKDVLQEFGLEAPVVLTSAKDGRGRKELNGWLDALLA